MIVSLTEDQITFLDVVLEQEIKAAIREKKDGYGNLAHFIWQIRDALKKANLEDLARVQRRPVGRPRKGEGQ